jgi:conjugal transfer ATP-binding protein TraC
MKLPFLPKKEKEIAKIIGPAPFDLKDILAPSSIFLSMNEMTIGKRKARSFFIFPSYPRYLSVGWLSSIINLNFPLDISFHIHPLPTEEVLKKLRKKLTEVLAELQEQQEKGMVRDPALEVAYHDLEDLRDKLTTAQERMFRVGIYITAYADTQEQLDKIETELRAILESKLIYIKPATLQQKEGFISTSPLGADKLMIHGTLNTSPLSTTFPFISFDLSANDGILYGINLHNNSLIIFDRFSLENANSVIFGKAGSGKSYLVKLEILRSLMMGTEVIVLDPENEYKRLTQALGGSFINISLASPFHLNPFDLPPVPEDENPEDVLRTSIINLVGLIRMMLGGLSPEEDAIVDQAITETYAAKDITPKTDPSLWPERIPLMEDFEIVLSKMAGAESLLRRIKRFTRGSFAQIFNHPTNIVLDNPFVVFGLRDMEDELKPIAMFIIMRYIWNKVRAEFKKRILVIDETWWLVQSEDGASFLFGLCKRARKYWLGVTTITQDVNDFMKSVYGQPIITNSSIQILMKQSPATIDVVQKTFNLTQGEKSMLLEAEIGEGIFFAGQKHVLMKVVGSYLEDQLITTNPEEVSKIKKLKQIYGE